jgi:hypothetical protein
MAVVSLTAQPVTHWGCLKTPLRVPARGRALRVAVGGLPTWRERADGAVRTRRSLTRLEVSTRGLTSLMRPTMTTKKRTASTPRTRRRILRKIWRRSTLEC